MGVGGRMKTINYRGEEYIVEDWVKFVATDSDGGIYGYENKPKKDCTNGLWDQSTEKVMFIENNNVWENSLEKV